MAIDQLYRPSAEDTIDINGNEVTAKDPWLLFLPAPSSIVNAYNQIELFGAGFGFPKQGDSHPDLSALKFITHGIEHFDSQQTKFLVTANWSNIQEDIDKKSSADPLDLPTDYSWEQVDRTVPVDTDAETGDLIQNSANKPFGDIFENKPLDRAVIIRNERLYNNASFQDIRNTVSRVPTKIDGETYKTGTLKLESVTAKKHLDQEDRTYFTITYKVLINPDGFVRNFIDRGNTDINGRSPSGLIDLNDNTAFLDGNGKFLKRGEDTVIIPVNTLKKVNWSNLRL